MLLRPYDHCALLLLVLPFRIRDRVDDLLSEVGAWKCNFDNLTKGNFLAGHTFFTPIYDNRLFFFSVFSRRVRLCCCVHMFLCSPVKKVSDQTWPSQPLRRFAAGKF